MKTCTGPGFSRRSDLPFLNCLSAREAAWLGLVVMGVKVPVPSDHVSSG